MKALENRTLTVLLVDDDVVTGMLHADYVRRMGHIPVVTYTGGDAIVHEMAVELNAQLKRRTPTERFVALTLVLIDPRHGLTEV